jgi:hypothetical protein
MMRLLPLVPIFVLSLTSCVHVKMDPVRVEPIEIKVDVFLTVDGDLGAFWRDSKQTSSAPPPETPTVTEG